MVKSCSLLPVLFGAGVLPLCAHALDTVELNSPDGGPMLVSAVSPPWPQSKFWAPTYVGLDLDDTSGPWKSRPVFQFPLAERPSAPVAFTASDAISVLEEIRLATPGARGAAPGSVAQFAAALAIAGLVARRRLAGH